MSSRPTKSAHDQEREQEILLAQLTAVGIGRAQAQDDVEQHQERQRRRRHRHDRATRLRSSDRQEDDQYEQSTQKKAADRRRRRPWRPQAGEIDRVPPHERRRRFLAAVEHEAGHVSQSHAADVHGDDDEQDQYCRGEHHEELARHDPGSWDEVLTPPAIDGRQRDGQAHAGANDEDRRVGGQHCDREQHAVDDGAGQREPPCRWIDPVEIQDERAEQQRVAKRVGAYFRGCCSARCTRTQRPTRPGPPAPWTG